METLTYPSGAVATYPYDAAGLVSEVQLTAGGQHPDARRQRVARPVRSRDRPYLRQRQGAHAELDSAYRTESQAVTGALDLNYGAYDAAGNLTSRTDAYANPADDTSATTH